MPRAPRIQFAGAFYHAFHRGNRRERIFLDDQDYAKFESILLEATAWSGVRLFRWSLLPNHFHLLLQTPDGNLAEFMQRLLTRYAKYFNWRHQLVGHVFQGRYGARLCDKNSYFMELIRYIELNPYRTHGNGLAKVGSWKWSSHRYYMMPESQWPDAVRLAFREVLELFGGTPQESRERYVRYLAEGLTDSRWEDFYKVKADRFLGDDAFVERTKRHEDEPVRQAERTHRKLSSTAELLEIVTTLSGYKADSLAGPSREKTLNQWRHAFIQIGRRLYRFPVKALADALGREASAASHVLRRKSQTEAQNPAVNTLMAELTRQVCQ